MISLRATAWPATISAVIGDFQVPYRADDMRDAGCLLTWEVGAAPHRRREAQDPPGVSAQYRRPVLIIQVHPVQDVHLFFEDVVPVSPPHRGVGPEEDPLGGEGADGVAEDLLEGRMTRREVAPVVRPRSVHAHRSEERRVGKECRSRWSPY